MRAKKLSALLAVCAIGMASMPVSAFADADKFGPGNSKKGPQEGGSKCKPGNAPDGPGCK